LEFYGMSSGRGTLLPCCTCKLPRNTTTPCYERNPSLDGYHHWSNNWRSGLYRMALTMISLIDSYSWFKIRDGIMQPRTPDFISHDVALIGNYGHEGMDTEPARAGLIAFWIRQSQNCSRDPTSLVHKSPIPESTWMSDAIVVSMQRSNTWIAPYWPRHLCHLRVT